MFQDLKKMGREILLTRNIVDAVTDKKPIKEELINLKLDKVLQNAKMHFREQPPRVPRCRRSLIELLVVLISNGMGLKDTELTEVFFAATQLFQIVDWPVRRLVYVLLDTLNPDGQEAFIVTACLIKEVEKGESAHRAKAIRRFTRVDTHVASQLESQLRNALMDESPVVASSALVYGEFLYHLQPEIVRRWSNEVTSALERTRGMTQAHAARLIFVIKKHDRLALMKHLKAIVNMRKRMDPTTMIYAIQQAEKLLRKSPGQDKDFESFIITQLMLPGLHTGHCAIDFQAAKSLVHLALTPHYLENRSAINLEAAIETLKSLLLHPDPVKRFGAIRSIHAISQSIPDALVNHTDDIQDFHKLQSSFPTLAILAISTLLNSGNDQNVDRLLEAIQLQGMADMPDGFRLDTIRAIRSLSKKFPHKHASFLSYLQSHTREDRSLPFKELLIQTIIEIGCEVPAAYRRCLDILCEFIEDSEYCALTSYCIDKISEMLCELDTPEAYVRFIFNRLILENANVRSTSLLSLTTLARKFSSIRYPILKLIELHHTDIDDSVREMSILCREAIIAEDSTAASEDDIFDIRLIDENDLPLMESLKEQYYGGEVADEEEIPKGVALDAIPPGGSNPIDERFDSAEDKETARTPAQLLSFIKGVVPSHIEVTSVSKRGTIQKLTEDEAEYLVFAQAIAVDAIGYGTSDPERIVVMELRMRNTLPDIVLTKVAPVLSQGAPGITPLGATEIDELKYGEDKICYFVLKVDRAETSTNGTTCVSLRYDFMISEGDMEPYEDSYDVEPAFLNPDPM